MTRTGSGCVMHPAAWSCTKTNSTATGCAAIGRAPRASSPASNAGPIRRFKCLQYPRLAQGCSTSACTARVEPCVGRSSGVKRPGLVREGQPRVGLGPRLAGVRAVVVGLIAGREPAVDRVLAHQLVGGPALGAEVQRRQRRVGAVGGDVVAVLVRDHVVDGVVAARRPGRRGRSSSGRRRRSRRGCVGVLVALVGAAGARHLRRRARRSRAARRARGRGGGSRGRSRRSGRSRDRPCRTTRASPGSACRRRSA